MHAVAFQLYLLSMMRASRRVGEALRQLGADRSDLGRARTEMTRLGLERLGHRIETYVSLLGPPMSEQEFAADPRGARAVRFRLPVWEDLAFVAYGDSAGALSQLRFERPPGTPIRPIQKTSDLEPWLVVEDDLEASELSRTVVDEWYPMKDVRCRLRGEGESLILLRFDFGLLQVAERAEEASEAGSRRAGGEQAK